MEKETNRALRRYYREIRSLLIVRSKETKRFMEDFSASVNDYMTANGITDFAPVREHFGAPEEIARGFVENTPLTYIRRRVRIKNTIFAVLLTALLVWLGYATIAFISGMPYGGEYGIEIGPLDDDLTGPGWVIMDEVHE